MKCRMNSQQRMALLELLAAKEAAIIARVEYQSGRGKRGALQDAIKYARIAEQHFNELFASECEGGEDAT